MTNGKKNGHKINIESTKKIIPKAFIREYRPRLSARTYIP